MSNGAADQPDSTVSVPTPRKKSTGRSTRRHDKSPHTKVAADAPTPEEWALQQLENAPQRSAEWVRKVATIYGLDVDGESKIT